MVTLTKDKIKRLSDQQFTNLWNLGYIQGKYTKKILMMDFFRVTQPIVRDENVTKQRINTVNKHTKKPWTEPRR